jgi:hypothetical protein
VFILKDKSVLLTVNFPRSRVRKRLDVKVVLALRNKFEGAEPRRKHKFSFPEQSGVKLKIRPDSLFAEGLSSYGKEPRRRKLGSY